MRTSPSFAIAVCLVLVAACGGGDTDSDGGLIGVVPGGSVTTSVAAAGGPGTTEDSTATTISQQNCPPEDWCQIEVPLVQIPLEMTPSSIDIDGAHAWIAAPDDGSAIEVDLAAAAVIRALPIGEAVVDVTLGAGSLWAVNYDFSFGPLLRVDPVDGTTLASIGDSLDSPMAVAIGGDAAWAVVDSYGRVARIDLASNVITEYLGGTEYAGGFGNAAITAGDGVLWALVENEGTVERIAGDKREIDLTVDDLGYAAETSGDTTSVLAAGARALAVDDRGLWVLSDVVSPTGGTNVVGGGALFLLDTTSGAVVRRIDLIAEPAFGRGGLAVTDGAAWYIEYNTGYPVRVDLDTERQTYVRLDNASAVGIATDGATVWMAVESLFQNNWVIGVSEPDASEATRALGS